MTSEASAFGNQAFDFGGTQAGPSGDTTGRRDGRRVRFRLWSEEDDDRDRDDAFSISQVTALARYVSDHGLDPEAKVLNPLYKAISRHHNARNETDRAAAREEILPLYARLCGITYRADRVNGRTVLNSARMWRNLRTLIFVGTAFFLAAAALGFWEIHLDTRKAVFVDEASKVATDAVQRMAKAEAAEREYKLLAVYGLKPVEWAFIIAFLTPFAWGGLGASIYLLKQLSDEAQSLTFDRQRLQGVNTRIFLGAVFAAVVTNLFVPMDDAISGEFKIGPSALAFLVGLGTKVIYSGFERMIEGLHERLSVPGRAPADDDGKAAGKRGASAETREAAGPELAAEPEGASETDPLPQANENVVVRGTETRRSAAGKR